MKKLLALALMTFSITISSAMPAFADWIPDGPHWYYEDQGVRSVSQWRLINGRWYYFNAQGIMTTGWQQINGHWYFMAQSGEMLTGWQQIGGKWYFMAPSGEMMTGWMDHSGTWYYMYPDGSMASGEAVADGKARTFASSGQYLYDGIRRPGLADDMVSRAFEIYAQSDAENQYLLKRINEVRAMAGAAPLSLDANACISAIYRSIEMNRYDYFAHEYHGEGRFMPVFESILTYSPDSYVIGENIYVTYYPDSTRFSTTPEARIALAEGSIDAYCNSPGHYRNMIDPSFTKVGFGPFITDAGHHYYCTQILLSDYQ